MTREAETPTGRRAKDPAADRAGLDPSKAEDIEDRQRLTAPMIYEVLRREGDEEMSRPLSSLWWSGVAAGMSISFSLLAQGVLQTHLPDRPWRPMVSDVGYCVGFLMVVLARQQLFTENTITGVLPLAATPNWVNLARLGRLWGVVLAANLAGTLFAALFCTFTPVLTSEVRDAMLQISQDAVAGGAVQVFFRAISAGFLIAAMVWLLPSAQGAQFWVIGLMTYLISIGGFAHVVAGSFEAFMLVASGRLAPPTMLDGFALPALAGNIVGGTALFALISYAQVAKEMP